MTGSGQTEVDDGRIRELVTGADEDSDFDTRGDVKPEPELETIAIISRLASWSKFALHEARGGC